MQNDENTLDTNEVEQDSETVEVGETSTEQSSDESQSETNEVTVESRLAKAEAEAAKYRRLFEKTQSKPKTAMSKVSSQPASPTNVEETVLLAQGIDEGLLKHLKDVAALKKVSLIKAQTDPLYIGMKEQFEKDKRQKDASVTASRGSGGVSVKKDTTTPGLTNEEHRAMLRERGIM